MYKVIRLEILIELNIVIDIPFDNFYLEINNDLRQLQLGMPKDLITYLNITVGMIPRYIAIYSR